MDKFILGFIIGGSPSTGSSLLRQVLNRHSSIVCAHETHIWSKQDIVKHWNSLKLKLNSGKILKLKDAGLFPFKGINKEEIPNFSDRQFNELINFDHSIFSFFNAFMRDFYGIESGQIFGEKTPANVFNFKDILELSKQFVCVHTVRNPYDTIASLVARGKAVSEATGFYLLNCSTALNTGKSERLITIKYENLVQDAQQEIQALLAALKLEFEEKMLLPSKPKAGEITKIDSWKYDETGEIGKQSVGRFEELPTSEQEEIISFVWNMKLKGEQNFKSIPEICEALNYRAIKPTGKFTKNRIAKFNSFNKRLMLKNINFMLNSPFSY